MNLSNIKEFVSRNSTTILAVTSSLGVLATAALASHDGIKADKLIREKKEELGVEKLAPMDTVETVWKSYIPTAISATATIGSIILSKHITGKQMAALAGAIGSSGYLLSEYKQSIKDIFGQDGYNEVVRDVAKKHKEGVQQAQIACINAQGGFYTVSDELETGNELFFDEFSQTWFRSSRAAVKDAFYHFNRNYTIGGCIEMCQLYEFLGIKPSYGGWYENWGYGWSFREQDINWIDFELVDAVDEESGEEYTIIAYCFMPEQLDISDVPATENELADVDYELSYAAC